MKSLLDQEILRNCREFHKNCFEKIEEVRGRLHQRSEFFESYRRICWLQSLKAEMIIPRFPHESANFFFEAHNDALVSHFNALTGSWRVALKALRSLIENMLCFLYYKDHPVELERWVLGEFRISVSEMQKYLNDHPRICKIDKNITGLDILKIEYATLSKAVHASAADFRMTDSSAQILLWDGGDGTSNPWLGKWASREKKVLQGICLLFTCFFFEEMQGTKASNLRALSYFTLSDVQIKKIRQELGVTIQEP